MTAPKKNFIFNPILDHILDLSEQECLCMFAFVALFVNAAHGGWCLLAIELGMAFSIFLVPVGGYLANIFFACAFYL